MHHPGYAQKALNGPAAIRLRRLWQSALWALVVIAPSAGAGADEITSVATRDFGLVGGREVVWVYQYRTEGEHDLRLLRFAYRPSEPGKAQGFLRPRRIEAVSGQVAAAAVLGPDLHLIYADGAHRRYTPRGCDVARNLPGNCTPLAMAGDDGGAAIYALVPSEAAAQLPSSAAESGPEPQTPTAAEGDPTQPAPDSGQASGAADDELEASQPTGPPGPPFSIVRFARGIWCQDHPGPEFLQERSRCWLAANGGRLHLLIAGEGARGRLAYSRPTDQGWTTPITVPDLGSDQVVGLTATPSEFVLVAVAQPGSSEPYLLCLTDDGFERCGSLEGSTGAVAATRFGRSLALAFLGDDNELRVGTWPLEGGAAVAQPEPVTALIPAPRPWIAERSLLIAYALLAVIVLGVVARRRDSLLLSADLPPELVLVPYWRRAVAFLIDALIFSPVALVILAPSLTALAEAQSFDEPERIPFVQQMTTDDFLRWLAATSLFAAYAAVFEALIGATPGKRILRCRVVTEHGQPCRLLAILLRNLMRLVEMFPAFDLMPAIVLILVTRNRQRLGDLVARTVVVQQLAPPSTTEHPNHPDLTPGPQ